MAFRPRKVNAMSTPSFFFSFGNKILAHGVSQPWAKGREEENVVSRT
jgi:hypothetical protein